MLLHSSLPKYRTSPPAAYRGHPLGAALLARRACTHTGCTPATPPRRRQKGWPARPRPAAAPGTGGATLFLSTQQGNTPNSHSLRAFRKLW